MAIGAWLGNLDSFDSAVECCNWLATRCKEGRRPRNQTKPPHSCGRFCLVFVCLLFGFCSYGPDRWDVEPVFLELVLEEDSILYLTKATLGCDSTIGAFAYDIKSLNSRP